MARVADVQNIAVCLTSSTRSAVNCRVCSEADGIADAGLVRAWRAASLPVPHDSPDYQPAYRSAKVVTEHGCKVVLAFFPASVHLDVCMTSAGSAAQALPDTVTKLEDGENYEIHRDPICVFNVEINIRSVLS